MKAFITTTSLFVALAGAPTAHAGEGSNCHFHGNKPVPEATVTQCAQQHLGSLIKSGKLDASWAGIKPAAMAPVDGKKGKEWKLTFQNPTAADKAKQNLYMFYAPSGNLIAANFTGQ